MKNLIKAYGEFYGSNLYLLGVEYCERAEKRVLSYIEQGFSAYEIASKLK